MLRRHNGMHESKPTADAAFRDASEYVRYVRRRLVLALRQGASRHEHHDALLIDAYQIAAALGGDAVR
jgi:hypothetical protein